MKIEVKKSTVLMLALLICIATGYFILQITFESIQKYGLAGYVNLDVFMTSLVFVIFELKREKDCKKIIESTIKEVAKENGKGLNHIQLENYKEELRDHLKNKFNNESYKL